MGATALRDGTAPQAEAVGPAHGEAETHVAFDAPATTPLGGLRSRIGRLAADGGSGPEGLALGTAAVRRLLDADAQVVGDALRALRALIEKGWRPSAEDVATLQGFYLHAPSLPGARAVPAAALARFYESSGGLDSFLVAIGDDPDASVRVEVLRALRGSDSEVYATWLLGRFGQATQERELFYLLTGDYAVSDLAATRARDLLGILTSRLSRGDLPEDKRGHAYRVLGLAGVHEPELARESLDQLAAAETDPHLARLARQVGAALAAPMPEQTLSNAWAEYLADRSGQDKATRAAVAKLLAAAEKAPREPSDGKGRESGPR